MVDIRGIEKSVLLKALWEKSKPASFFTLSRMNPPPMDQNEFNTALERGKADYLSGRVIKMDFSGDSVEPSGYDRDNGKGSVQRIVDSLR